MQILGKDVQSEVVIVHAPTAFELCPAYYFACHHRTDHRTSMAARPYVQSTLLIACDALDVRAARA
jgi:hypothetical protein